MKLLCSWTVPPQSVPDQRAWRLHCRWTKTLSEDDCRKQEWGRRRIKKFSCQACAAFVIVTCVHSVLFITAVSYGGNGGQKWKKQESRMGGPIICEWWVMSNTGKSAINIPDSKITMSVHSSFLPAYLPSFFLFFFFR